MAGFFEMAADKEVVSGAIVKEAAVFDKFLQVRIPVILSQVCHHHLHVWLLRSPACILRLDNDRDP